VNQNLAPDLGEVYDFDVQARFLKEGLPDGDCRALVVDLDSVAPERLALQRLVKELSWRPHPYPVVVFGYNLEDNQLADLRAAGIQVFRTAGLLTGAGMGSVKTLVDLQNDVAVPPGVRRRSARDVLEMGLKFREIAELEQRLAAIEQRLSGADGQAPEDQIPDPAP